MLVGAGIVVIIAALVLIIYCSYEHRKLKALKDVADPKLDDENKFAKLNKNDKTLPTLDELA